ncbi:hypothetical protein [Lysinibacillus sp. FSL M8-0355]|uniref:hypothetical protein n=1 Tax=Lysinibacillus sp. FSL M8-0355 TaxID=2921719 RepID=UPI0030F63B86
MNVIRRLTEVLEQKLVKKIMLHEIGYETMWFMHDEIDEEIVPLNILSILAEPVICESANYTDDEGNYYTLIIIETGNVNPYEAWLVNDKVIENFAEGDSI